MVDFDPIEWELRGRIPRLIAPDKKENIETVTDRVESQVSWLAQLLGHNGPNYWPREKLTVFQKRALIQGTYGLYNRLNTDYEDRTYPNNQSQVYTIADKSFRFSDDGLSVIPLDQSLDIPYEENALFLGAEYAFEGEVTAIPVPDEIEYDCLDNVTRIKYLSGITAEINGITFELVTWEDRSDWVNQDDNFDGLWAQKGGYYSLHYAFDALELHGYIETNDLDQQCTNLK